MLCYLETVLRRQFVVEWRSRQGSKGSRHGHAMRSLQLSAVILCMLPLGSWQRARHVDALISRAIRTQYRLRSKGSASRNRMFAARTCREPACPFVYISRIQSSLSAQDVLDTDRNACDDYRLTILASSAFPQPTSLSPASA